MRGMKLKIISNPMYERLEESVNRFIKDLEIVSISFTSDDCRFYAYILYKE